MKTSSYQINLVFPTPENFCQHYQEIREGAIFLPMKSPLSQGAAIVLHLQIPLVDLDYYIKGTVTENFDRGGKVPGIRIDCRRDIETILPELEDALAANHTYCKLLGISDPDKSKIFNDFTLPVGKGAERTVSENTVNKNAPGGENPRAEIDNRPETQGTLGVDTGAGLSIGWLRDAVTQVEAIAEEERPVIQDRTVIEKVELTAEDRSRAEPVGNFIMNLTRAMSRSGYYHPDHPGAIDAKEGLYDEFVNILGDAREIMITNRDSREYSDILIIGVLDEPVSVRTLVGQGVAGLFVPKLKEFCERKDLISFAIKKDIPPAHFKVFIDIMSDPKVEHHQDRHDSTGAYLTRALVNNGITEISTVFADDMISLERNLPWRVEMAIQRLTKDLRVMPMFKGLTKDSFKEMKQQIVEDILRPLRHPRLLNDFLVNCYIIAQYVDDIDAEDIEEIIVESFPFDQLLPTVHFTFEELQWLSKAREKEPENRIIATRLMGIKRILKLVARRVIQVESSGGQRFLDQLYQHRILRFEELPIDVQYVIKTRIMAEDVRNNLKNYINGILSVESSEDGIVYLKCFRRVMPLLIEKEEWPIVMEILRGVHDASARKPVGTKSFSEGLLAAAETGVIVDETANMVFLNDTDAARRPLIYVFKEVTHQLVMSYMQHLSEHENFRKMQPMFEEIISRLGLLGIEILSRVLSSNATGMIRKSATDSMLKLKGDAHDWALRVLSEKKCPPQLCVSAIVVLTGTVQDPSDFEAIRPLVTQGDPGLRGAAIDAVVNLRPPDAEELLIHALNDPDAKVRWRAVRSLDQFAPISENSMRRILSMISSEPADIGQDTADHINKIVRLISAINAMSQIPIPGRVESCIIGVAEKYFHQQSGWKRLFAKEKDHALVVLRAAIPLLTRIGGPSTVAFLKGLPHAAPPYADMARQAMDRMSEKEAESD